MYWIIGIWVGSICGMLWLGSRSYKRSESLKSQNMISIVSMDNDYEYVSGEE